MNFLAHQVFRTANHVRPFHWDHIHDSSALSLEPVGAVNISIVLPSTVVFVASDAQLDLFQLSLYDPDPCPMFNRWQRLGKSEITVDF
jgi:hypothetical protein